VDQWFSVGHCLIRYPNKSAFLDLHHLATQVRSDFAELFEGGFEVFDDFLGEDIGSGGDCRTLPGFRL
jgi:hypothetical protein